MLGIAKRWQVCTLRDLAGKEERSLVQGGFQVERVKGRGGVIGVTTSYQRKAALAAV